MNSGADPLDGWPFREVVKRALPASSDLYGGLYSYLKTFLAQFCQRLATLNIRFTFTQADARHFETSLKQFMEEPRDTFDRIEVSLPHTDDT